LYSGLQCRALPHADLDRNCRNSQPAETPSVNERPVYAVASSIRIGEDKPFTLDDAAGSFWPVSDRVMPSLTNLDAQIGTVRLFKADMQS
jgi:hypothetical protein